MFKRPIPQTKKELPPEGPLLDLEIKKASDAGTLVALIDQHQKEHPQLINHKTPHGGYNTPLLLTLRKIIKNKSEEIADIQALLDKGADVNLASPDDDSSPLCIAAPAGPLHLF